ncbi:protein eyes shut [Anthonomus grandis grandis]|uniref:protein eyes shut n=1 Tax=Anthonomus grandis grandis TaxID=2921223 RepID=UPI002166232D|nr:protein eyes shut [Anthonomus grandis grandis]
MPSFLVLLLVIIPFPSGGNGGFACLSNPCVHGVCLDDLNSTYFCYCIDGYTGLQCQTNWDDCWSNPCQNGGVCVDGVAGFNCTCPSGFVGDFCEQDFNECESNPCWNNATCVDGPNGYQCECLPGYKGVHCEVDIAVCNTTNETRCHNGGVCEEGPGDTFFCVCQPGWEGFLCDIETNECMSTPCQNGAICIDLHATYECACLFGYTGKNCEELMQICSKNPCKNGALCLLEDTLPVCYCVPDFHGDLCQYQYDECQLGPKCSNGGTCIDGIDNFTCSCPPNLTGTYCECLQLPEKELDCDYVVPPTTTTTTTTTYYSSTTFLTTLETEFSTSYDVFSTTSFEEPTTTELVTTTEQVPNTTTTPPETTTTPLETTTTSYSNTSITSIVPTTEPYSTTITIETEYTTESVSTTTTTTELTSLEPTTTEEFISTTLSEASTTPMIIITEPVMIFSTTSTTQMPSTSVESSWTTQPIESTTFSAMTETTYWPTPETNRSFPDITTTTEPELTSFLTDRPMTSTFSVTEPTTFTAVTTETVDCSLPDTMCLNGGSCVFSNSGHKCECPFDTEGLFCEVKLGIKHAAFSGESYLTHKLPENKNISIEFDAKTLSKHGLIFFVHLDTSYMVLYIENGALVFKFSCGYQTMLLSELKIQINNGIKMTIKANLEFSKNLSHCDAKIRVNDTISMRGDQVAKIDKYFKKSFYLHLGGVPNDFAYDGIPSSGFIGCMSNLKISNKRVLIYKEAEDGYDITECASLACLSNPCQNGARCTSLEEDWICHCRNGYLGKMCEISICDNNPCLFGGTCIPFSNNGYICLCPYSKHGHFCENDLKISEPYFSSTVRGLSSYLAYPLPQGIAQKMELKFRFTPTNVDQIALLLFIGQSGHHDFFSDHLAISFVKGYIMLTWNMGSGPRRIFTSQPIDKGARDYLVQAGYEGKRAWLYVDSLGNVTGRSPGKSVQLDVVPLLYLGGHDLKNFSGLPHDLPLHTGFSGCIFDIEVKIGSIILPLQYSMSAIGRAVGQCGTTECYEKRCQNKGACLHHGSTFMCLCQDNWFGPLCSSRVNFCDANFTKCHDSSRCVPLLSTYECDCPFGKVGRHCDKAENFTDISFTGQRSYLETRPFEFDNSKLNVEMELRILKDTGIVFFIGRKEGSYVCLSLQSGSLELRVRSSKLRLNTKDPVVVRGSKLLLKGAWHKIQFGIFGRKVYLYVDHVINMAVLDHGFLLSLSKDSVYLGGLPDLSKLPITASSSLPKPYTGCLRYLTLNEHKVSFTTGDVLSSRNIIDCDGTPCGGEACQNGGTCWLDSLLNPHCLCLEPYYGEHCEFTPKCTEANCKNGICHNSSCYCHVGFDGGFCETQLQVRTPSFVGKSYLIVEKMGDKRRSVKDLEIRKLYLNFTTASPDGLLVWTKMHENYLGLGLDNGLLKIVYSDKCNNTQKHLVEIVPFFKLNDGLWHTVELSFVPLALIVDTRNLDVFGKNRHDVTILTNGVFYIGGLPSNLSLVNETSGVFSDNFEGCIQAFAPNSDKLITDFSDFEGYNIENCPVL